MKVTQSKFAMVTVLLHLISLVTLLMVPTGSQASRVNEQEANEALSPALRQKLRNILEELRLKTKPNRPWRPYYIQQACENSVIRISCPSGSTISMNHVMYGPSALGQCPETGLEELLNEEGPDCGGLTYSQRAKRIFSSICNGKRSCEVPVIRYLFGNPCPFSPKILEVYYGCVGETSSGVNDTS